MGVQLTTNLRKLQTGLERQLTENSGDIDALERRREELVEERRDLIRGIEGIRREIAELEGD